MKKIIGVLVCSICFMLTACAQNDDAVDPAKAYLESAQKYIDAGDIETAKKALSEGYSVTGDEALKNKLDELLKKDEKVDSSGEETADELPQTEEPTESIADQIADILYGDREFIDVETGATATLQTLPSVNEFYMGIPDTYATCDLDGDGAEELIVHYDFDYETAILKRYDDGWYSYRISYRGILGLKTDGTTIGYNGASSGSIHRMEFSKQGFNYINIVEWDEYTSTFTINNNAVTYDEIEAQWDLHDKKQDVIFEDI